ncbi:MAG TPA: low temperature requirement protein A [Solirubrobacterales bacterium]|jgi:low temperature requirement protein LtrA|nr:low temperature requirement protein A [Solirubrobacterales bacterium]
MDAERAGEERVTPLELFFDLVFVLSFTQVTLKMADHPGWESLGEGLLILAAVWWAWCAYGWLTNSIDPDENLNRVCMFSAMAGMLVVSLSIPDAFGDRGVLFGCSYFFVRAMQLLLYVRNTPGASADGDLQAILRLAPGFLLGSALLIVAGVLDDGARASTWILAILIDWTTPLFFGTEEFHLDPGHFAERHGLIVMIALGESILAIGAAAGFTLSTGQVFAAVFGIAAVAALWWAYFDVVAIVAERRLTEAPPGEQAPLARDAYSYLHFPLIAGIVLLALGLKETLAATGEPLETVPALALTGGPALYLLGQVAFRERILGSFSPHRALAAAALLALIPLALGADALIALAAVSIVLAILIAYEAVHYREQRARVRANPGATLAEMRGT